MITLRKMHLNDEAWLRAHSCFYIEDRVINALLEDLTYTAVEGNTIKAMGGIVADGLNNGRCWIAFANDVGIANMRELIKIMQIYFENTSVKNIEATVRVDNPRGVRLVKRLGFQLAGKRRKYDMDETDHYILKG